MIPPARVTRVSIALVAVSMVALAFTARTAAAQQAPATASPQWEGHLATALSPGAGLLGGIGVNVRAGWYSRVGLALTAGAVRDGDTWQARQRLDATARFVFDPFGEQRRGFYAGAGLGAERAADGATRGLLLGVVGVEGLAVGRVVPAVEFTLGGGARLALVLRARRARGR